MNTGAAEAGQPLVNLSEDEWTQAIADVAAVTVDDTLEDLVEWYAERASDDSERLLVLALDRTELRRRVAEKLRPSQPSDQDPEE